MIGKLFSKLFSLSGARSLPHLGDYLTGATGRRLEVYGKQSARRTGGRLLTREEQATAATKYQAELNINKAQQLREQDLANALLPEQRIPLISATAERAAQQARPQSFLKDYRAETVRSDQPYRLAPARENFINPRFQSSESRSVELTSYYQPERISLPRDPIKNVADDVVAQKSPSPKMRVDEMDIRKARQRTKPILEERKKQNIVLPSHNVPLKKPKTQINSPEYEQAYRSKQIAQKYLLERVLPATATFAVLTGGSSYLTKKAEREKTIRGESAYRDIYGTAPETFSSFLSGVANYSALEALVLGNTSGYLLRRLVMGRTPAEKAAKAMRQKVQASRLRSLNAIAKAEEDLKIRDKLIQIEKDTPITEISKQLDDLAKIDRAVVKNKRKIELANARLHPYATGLGKASAKVKTQFGKIYEKFKKPAATTKGLSELEKELLNDVPNLKRLKELEELQVPKPEPKITKGTGKFLSKAFGTRERVAIGAGVIGAGAMVGMNRPAYPAAEGDITEITSARESTVSRLNYSTAGLVQAIHNNRRRM